MTVKEIREKIKGDKKMIIILAVGSFGMILLLISSFTGNANDKKTQSAEKTTLAAVSDFSVSEVENALEEKLRNMVNGIKGAGNADVMVTVASSGEYVYAENQKTQSDDNSLSEDREIVIHKSTGNGDSGLVISVKSPSILGVAVICDGGESAVVASEIKNMVTSLFGIGSDRVYVGARSAK